MTEAEWLAATDPVAMLQFLQDSGKTYRRKLRFLAVASCRRIWDRIFDSLSRRAVAMAERFIEGQASVEESTAAGHAAEQRVRSEYWRNFRLAEGSRAAIGTALEPAWNPDEWWLLFRCIVVSAARAAGGRTELYWQSRDDPTSKWGIGCREEAAAQCVLLRDLIGNPFGPAAIDTARRAWHAESISMLARAAYEHCWLPEGTLEPQRLAVLADALEDAGCTDAELLGHLRGPGPHVRGCWAVDLTLSKG